MENDLVIIKERCETIKDEAMEYLARSLKRCQRLEHFTLHLEE